ncbi:DUF3954 domain-containing protein [uncultured Metabacillus sp.]|uniref:DUF3954 domain-containing protein n=1 Tax=uncultured Metabacillus sp. TaxID=2860135 RepID=UPI002612525F|nr:DUF3954 domain-containing protein [uncultured Metabacillus sp.]
MDVNIERMTANIDLMENAVYAVRDGKLLRVPTPPDGFGKQIIEWEHGKPLKGKYESSFKIK